MKFISIMAAIALAAVPTAASARVADFLQASDRARGAMHLCLAGAAQSSDAAESESDAASRMIESCKDQISDWHKASGTHLQIDDETISERLRRLQRLNVGIAGVAVEYLMRVRAHRAAATR